MRVSGMGAKRTSLAGIFVDPHELRSQTRSTLLRAASRSRPPSWPVAGRVSFQGSSEVDLRGMCAPIVARRSDEKCPIGVGTLAIGVVLDGGRG